MTDPIKESSPQITPDTLRKINLTNKAFYDSYTKKNYGRSDVLGSQYSGTVENFGYEMLLEARKIRMERPSLQGVFGINTMEYYFDIQYSNMIETYEQQGMLEAVLRKDVFLPNKEYRIRFENCDDVLIPRSESWGALNETSISRVYKNEFIHTKTSPILVITDIEDSTVEEIELSLKVDNESDVDYYFYNGFSMLRHIDSYEDGVLLTNPITNEFAELSFIWICEDIFKSLPPVNFIGNVFVPGKPVMVIGTDGHAVSHIYPLIYGTSSLPEQSSEGSWYLKAYSELDGFLPGNQNNNSSKISKITLSFIENDTETETDYDITFEEEYIKICLSDRITWEFVRDDITSPYYAKKSLSQFYINGSVGPWLSLMEAFDIKFSNDYLFIPYEGLCEDATVGIHVDILSDYSENAVPKLNGIIHSLGEFDGLPSYFKTMKERSTHRSHIELYAIRDRLNEYTQTTTKKQTAGLIFDTALPQKELTNTLEDQDPAIVHVFYPGKIKYITLEDKVISKKNILTEVTYDGYGKMGNCRMAKSSNKPKFIYHGNGVFSLTSMVFDPELELGRVFYVGNDPISYANNAITTKKKPPLTMARICDIPTSYEQLMHVEYQSPTYLFDDKYVRTECGMTFDDLDELFNRKGVKLIMTPARGAPGMQWIYWGSLPNKNTLVEAGYVRYINISDPNIPITENDIEILNHGTGYAVDDEFYVMIGPTAYNGKVETVGFDGNVTAYTLELNDDSIVSVYNIEGTSTPLKTHTISSENGSDFQLVLTLTQHSIDVHTISTIDTTPPENVVALKYDAYNNIFLYELQEDWSWLEICQVEGERINNNPYDVTDRNTRTFDCSFFHNILRDSNIFDTEAYTDHMSWIDVSTIVEYAVGIKGDTETADLSEYITSQNMPNTLYRLIMTSELDNGHYDLKKYSLKSSDGYEVILPRFNENNTLKYYNPSNRLLVTNIGTWNDNQPTLFVYFPTYDTFIDLANYERDTILVRESHKASFRDYGSDIVSTSRKLRDNIYYYPEYELRDEYYEAKDQFMQMGRSDLISYIRNKFGPKSEPFMFEDSDYKYTHDMLVNYIMDRWPIDEPEYIKDNLKLLGISGQIVIDPNGNPTGKNPTGSFVPVTSDIIDINVKCNNKSQISHPLEIFMIDDETFDGFEDGFRIHDDNGTDISESSIVIWNKDRYIFRNSTWIKIDKAN